jgi:integrase
VRRTKQSVLNGLKELQRQAEAGVAPDKTRTVAQYVDWWLNNVAPETVSPDTLVDYRWQLEHYVIPHIGHIRLAKLTPADVQKMLRSLEKAGYSPRTRQYARAILRRALSWAEGTGGIVMRNAAALVDGPKKRESKLDDSLIAEEAKAVLDAARDDSLEALAVLVLKFGLRKGEVLAMPWSSVELDAGRLSVAQTLKRRGWQHGCDDPAACAEPHHRKGCTAGCEKHQRCPKPCAVGCVGHAAKCPQRQGGGLHIKPTPKSAKSRRTLPLVAGTQEALKLHRERQLAEKETAVVWMDDSLVFTTEAGTPIDPRNLNRWWNALLKKAELGPRRFHASRHTAATLLLDSGVPLEVVSAILGHATLAVTSDIYAKVTEDAKRRALIGLEQELES